MSNTDNPDIVMADESDRLMLLLIGKPFTGKTWAASTFPNPLFLDFDHKGKAGTRTVPFWSGELCDKYAPRTNPNAPPNKRDALLYYLQRNIGRPTIPANTTLIVDSGTAVEAAFHNQTEKVESVPMGKGNKPDGFHVWKEKMKYFPALFELLKTHPGHVIYIMHEQDEKNEEGLPNGRIKPLMNGSFVDQIAAHFTAMFRQRVEVFDNQNFYVWDVVPTKAFDCGATFGNRIGKPKLKADYSSLAEFFPNYQV